MTQYQGSKGQSATSDGGVQCLCPSSAPRTLCCDRETHVSLNNVGEYIVFPAETVHQGFFSAVNKIVVQVQLFADTAIVQNCRGLAVQQHRRFAFRLELLLCCLNCQVLF